MFIYSQEFYEYGVCALDVLTVDAYQEIVKIADRQASVQIVVGKSVVAGIILINQQQLISMKFCFAYCLSDFCFIFWKILTLSLVWEDIAKTLKTSGNYIGAK